MASDSLDLLRRVEALGGEGMRAALCSLAVAGDPAVLGALDRALAAAELAAPDRGTP